VATSYLFFNQKKASIMSYFFPFFTAALVAAFSLIYLVQLIKFIAKNCNIFMLTTWILFGVLIFLIGIIEGAAKGFLNVFSIAKKDILN
jgi:hypothetical protein